MPPSYRNRLRPATYANTSVSSYYRRRYGEELIPQLKAIELDINKKAVFDGIVLCIKQKTLYQKVYQGFKWLAEKHEESARWNNLRNLTSVFLDGRFNVVIRKKDISLPLNTPGAVTIEDNHAIKVTDRLRDTIVDYCTQEATPDTKPLEITKGFFSDDDLEWMSMYFGGLDEQIAVIKLDRNNLKILKNEELAKRLKEQSAS